MDAQAATLHRNEDLAGIDALAATEPNGTSGVASVAAEFPVQSWERYEILSIIGRGGMGAVYKARDRRLDRMVALKFLRVDDANLLARFQREASTQARLDHPNICRVFEVGEVERKPYIAMQFVDGKTIDQAAPSLSLFEKVVLIKQVALALHEAHRLGIIHRDVKPSNIMVVRKEDGTHQPLVMDFGIAHEARENRGLTETGAVMGTPAYMSPEQARGGSRGVDRRADVYSLGATLYELLSGKAPFGGAEVVDVLLAVLNEEPRPPRSIASDVPRDLETIVLKCLAKEVGQRYDSARALAEDLQRYIDGEPILGKRASLLFRLRRQYRRHRALFAIGAVASMIILTMVGVGLRERVRSQRQTQLAQRLASEMKDMEWLLRSARQLPLHDLKREKVIIRRRMQQLRMELSGYGSAGQGLAHYAIGRGHLALHEYPQALVELRLAQQAGQDGADLHYALGIVLGKHYEQAMWEARLSGGGDWAQKQLKEIAPRYLNPAIVSLERARSLHMDAPQYLEAIISFYQADWDRSLQQIEEVRKTASWLYESTKLSGDIHHEKALLARDSGKYEIAEQEFAKAIAAYEEASDSARSDTEVYEGLAETRVRQVEMAMMRGQSMDAAYEQVQKTCDKVLLSEPDNFSGHLKRAFAAIFVMTAYGAGKTTPERVHICLDSAEAALQLQPGNPYATETAAVCNGFAAEQAEKNGKNPEPYINKWISLLESVLKDNPRFLWGMNDLSNGYYSLSLKQAARNDKSVRGSLEKALEYNRKARLLDPNYTNAFLNALSFQAELIPLLASDSEISKLRADADEVFSQCTKINNQHGYCYQNYADFLIRLAEREFTIGRNPQTNLKLAFQHMSTAAKYGGAILDAEQYSALGHFLAASDFLQRQQNPTEPLAQLHGAIERCLKLAPTDQWCLSLSIKNDWLTAEWLANQGKSNTKILLAALVRAENQTKLPETNLGNWQVLAETYLRLARQAREPQRSEHVLAGHTALAKAFAINPNHATGRATEGELFLLAAEAAQGAKQKELALAAQHALERSATNDPLGSARLALLRRRAGELLGPM